MAITDLTRTDGSSGATPIPVNPDGSIAVGNTSGTYNTNSGSAGAQTLRTVLSTASRTPTKTTETVSGSVSAGAQSVTFVTSSDFTGSILGDTTPASVVINISANGNDTLGAIAYVITTGSIQIITLI